MVFLVISTKNSRKKYYQCYINSFGKSKKATFTYSFYEARITLISRSHKDIKSRKGIKDKGRQIEVGKCSEHRKHGEQEIARGLKKLQTLSQCPLLNASVQSPVWQCLIAWTFGTRVSGFRSWPHYLNSYIMLTKLSNFVVLQSSHLKMKVIIEPPHVVVTKTE